MHKRGASQLDWIISLALFLLYIIWIFIFIKPSLNFGSSKNSLITILTENFEDDFSWEMKRYPLFLEYNSSGGRKTLMLSYPLNMTDIYFAEGMPFIIWNQKLIFVGNVIEGMNYFWIIEGLNKTTDYYLEELNLEEDRAAIENLTVYFDDSMPDTLLYKGEEFIESMSYRFNEYSFSPSNYSSSNIGFGSFFSAKKGNINHTSAIFAYSPEINYLITLDQNNSYTMEITAELHDFDAYYSDNSHYGNFDYTNISQNINYSFNYITLTKNDESISMFFDSDAEYEFEYYNSTLIAIIKINVYDKYNYFFQFHDGDHLDAKRKYYSSEFGAIDTLLGINIHNISNNYTSLKERWGFPKEQDFQILIYDNSTAFNYLLPDPIIQIGEFKAQNNNIFVHVQDEISLDENGEYKPISLLYRIW